MRELQLHARCLTTRPRRQRKTMADRGRDVLRPAVALGVADLSVLHLDSSRSRPRSTLEALEVLAPITAATSLSRRLAPEPRHHQAASTTQPLYPYLKCLYLKHSVL
jgi:hypothetical protein